MPWMEEMLMMLPRRVGLGAFCSSMIRATSCVRKNSAFTFTSIICRNVSSVTRVAGWPSSMEIPALFTSRSSRPFTCARYERVARLRKMSSRMEVNGRLDLLHHKRGLYDKSGLYHTPGPLYFVIIGDP